ncbi:MAG: hypothetical protein NTY99_01320, partial [DPANN group archaeon]|nr:hypothetical protein [DPANN group archaeon]
MLEVLEPSTLNIYETFSPSNRVEWEDGGHQRIIALVKLTDDTQKICDRKFSSRVCPEWYSILPIPENSKYLLFGGSITNQEQGPPDHVAHAVIPLSQTDLEGIVNACKERLTKDIEAKYTTLTEETMKTRNYVYFTLSKYRFETLLTLNA